MVVGDDPPLTEAQIRVWNLTQWALIIATIGCFYLMATAPILRG
jgi:hypothetical protein